MVGQTRTVRQLPADVFRQLRIALEAEASFYAQVFGIELADAVEPVEITRRPATAPGRD